MGLLFSSSSDSSTRIDNSITDASTNINNAGALQATDGSQINITDGGAVNSALSFAGGTVDRVLDNNQTTFLAATSAVKDSNRLLAQQATQAVDQSLGIARVRSASDAENIMGSVVKIGIAIAAVFAVGFIAQSRGK